MGVSIAAKLALPRVTLRWEFNGYSFLLIWMYRFIPVCIGDLTYSLFLFCFSGSAAAYVLIFALLAFADKVAEDVVKHAVDTVAVAVVVTVDVVKEIAALVTADKRRSLHTCIGEHSALLGCRHIDSSKGDQERALSLATFKNSVKLEVIDRA